MKSGAPKLLPSVGSEGSYPRELKYYVQISIVWCILTAIKILIHTSILAECISGGGTQ